MWTCPGSGPVNMTESGHRFILPLYTYGFNKTARVRHAIFETVSRTTKERQVLVLFV